MTLRQKEEDFKMGIVVIGAVFVDIKGFPETALNPSGKNAGNVVQIHGGVGRNVAEDIANVELRPTFVSLVDQSGTGIDVIQKLKNHRVNTDYIRATRDGMGTWLMGMLRPLFPSARIYCPLRIFWSSRVMRSSGMLTASSLRLTWIRKSSRAP